MDHGTQSFMESRFGTDFSDVRIHTGSQAVQMSRGLNAQAFTVGNDVYFNEGKYSPNFDSGKHLLAHELTHTVQQGGGIGRKVQRDYATDVSNPNAVFAGFNGEEIDDAIAFNQRQRFSESDISLFRDVLGLNADPAIIDEDFINAIGEYQAQNNLGVDGKMRIGGVTARRLARELRAEGRFLAPDPEGTELTNSAQRLTPFISHQTVVTNPSPRTRDTIGVGEEVNLSHSSGDSQTAWTTTAGTFSTPTGARVVFTAPDTDQTVTISAGNATLRLTIIAPTNVHMDNVGGTVKHHLNLPDSGILTDVFLLPDTVNFSKVTYREIDVLASSSGAYSCHNGIADHCHAGGSAPCGSKLLLDSVITGKGTKSVLGDCAYSGSCGGSPPFTPGNLSFSIPYEYKVGTGAFIRFTTVNQSHSLAPDASTLSSSKAGASGTTTVAAVTSLIGSCP
jgi:hypothetical protein